MPAFPGSSNGDSDELYTTSSIPIPSESTLNDQKIKTFILQQKKKLLLSGKFVAPGHEILKNELVLRWRTSSTFNSIKNPIYISDSEEELKSGRISPDQSDVCIDRVINIALNNTIPRDYCRRVVVSSDTIYTVSMFGDLQTVDLKRSTTKTIKEGAKQTNVQDAMFIDNSLVYASKDSLSVFNVLQGEEVEYPTKLKITCLVPFAVGGDLSLVAGTECGLGYWLISNDKAKYKKLDNSKTRINAIALQNEGMAISSSGRKLRIFDITENKNVTEGVMSSFVNQLKINSDSPNLLAMEVSHLDRQIHILDLRTPLFTKPPVIEMGYRIPDISQYKNSRFVKGDMLQNLYVRGYEDGTINLFDLRRPDRVATITLAQRTSPVVHCILCNANLAYAVGKNTFSFIDFSLS